MSESLSFIIFGAIAYSAPLIVAAIGGLFSERSGVVNIGIEGMMTIGAFSGAATAVILETNGMIGISAFVGYIVAIIIGGLFGLLHAYLSVSLKIDQIISGVAINTITLAIALYMTEMIFGQGDTPVILHTELKLGDLGVLTMLVYILIPLIWWIIYRTRRGSHILAVGENPQAADAMGINVAKVRYQAVILSGMFSGFAGMLLVMNVDNKFSSSTVAGFGFIALAVLIFGRHNPFGVAVAGTIFGLAKELGAVGGVYDFKWPFTDITLPPVLLIILPYVVTIIVLIIFSRNKRVEMEAMGQPYDKEMR